MFNNCHHHHHNGSSYLNSAIYFPALFIYTFISRTHTHGKIIRIHEIWNVFLSLVLYPWLFGVFLIWFQHSLSSLLVCLFFLHMITSNHNHHNHHHHQKKTRTQTLMKHLFISYKWTNVMAASKFCLQNPKKKPKTRRILPELW